MFDDPAFSQLIDKTSLIIHVIKNIEPNTTALVIRDRNRC